MLLTASAPAPSAPSDFRRRGALVQIDIRRARRQREPAHSRADPCAPPMRHASASTALLARVRDDACPLSPPNHNANSSACITSAGATQAASLPSRARRASRGSTAASRRRSSRCSPTGRSTSAVRSPCGQPAPRRERGPALLDALGGAALRPQDCRLRPGVPRPALLSGVST